MRIQRYELPDYVRSILAALSFSAPNGAGLREIDETDWPKALDFCDRSQLALPLYVRSKEHLPQAVRSRLKKNLDQNALRWLDLKVCYRQLASLLEDQGIEFAVLKGFSQWPLFVSNPAQRVQYDIDILVHPDQAQKAAGAVSKLGYEMAQKTGAPSTDHLPTMIRKTGWTWRGDYYDPDIPYSLELHFRCWNREAERFGPDGLEERFWNRVSTRTCDDLRFQALSRPDSVLYGALHSLRHLLHGNLKLSHVYEIAYLLDSRVNDNAFWAEWDLETPHHLRQEQAICFALAQRWFGNRLHEYAEHAIASLPDEISRWLHFYCYSPIGSAFRSNKDEVWLHWVLVHTAKNRMRVLTRKFVPGGLPGPVDALHLCKQQRTLRILIRSRWRYLLFLSARLKHHVASLWPTACSAVQWFAPSRRQTPDYTSSKFTSVLQSRHK
jgi:hypothetical protein